MADDLLAFWKRRDGISSEEIELLQVDDPVHHWTISGCEVMTVSAPPKADGGLMTVWVGRVREDGTPESCRVNARKGQFHRPQDCHRIGGKDAVTRAHA